MEEKITWVIPPETLYFITRFVNAVEKIADNIERIRIDNNYEKKLMRRCNDCLAHKIYGNLADKSFAITCFEPNNNQGKEGNYIFGRLIKDCMESKNEPVEIPDWCCWNKKFKK